MCSAGCGKSDDLNLAGALRASTREQYKNSKTGPQPDHVSPSILSLPAQHLSRAFVIFVFFVFFVIFVFFVFFVIFVFFVF